ncbi:uncharacterized protein LOC112057181 [Bicyclus anynana]|uniref:Uncharacterized protein LOC112057181 n=1 Tax=Bicyclus anynana TaxID=110368 RepID=A0ABM3M957_BICAN|nr:uncharacterized protein LOC112057181 [Bicyclus anynana]
MPQTRSQTGLSEDQESVSDMSAADVVPGAGASRASSQPTRVVMTDQQLSRLLQQVLRAQSVDAPPSSPSCVSTGNFAKCTARFDGTKDSDVLAFIDAIETYKDCVCMEDRIAIRGLPMLLGGIAATWWQGVKQSVHTWTEATDLLKKTFGPRLPPHRIYRELFSREQGEEATDIFICKARALLSQLPPQTLREDVQLDMVYGLLNKRIREKVARSSCSNFMELLEEARRVEDLCNEGHSSGRRSSASTGTTRVVTPLCVPSPPSSHSQFSSIRKLREKCVYCKIFGHRKENCLKLKKKEEDTKTVDEPCNDTNRYTLTCFGCGAPGVIRSRCPTCTKKTSTTNEQSSSSAFLSVTASGICVNPRSRPILNIDVLGQRGRAIIDTGAKQCIASNSFRKYLVKSGTSFKIVNLELKFADGSVRTEPVETACVEVGLKGVVIPTLFIVLPNAKDSLLGMDFISDAGMVLDFSNRCWSMSRVAGSFPLEYESLEETIRCSAVQLQLREEEGSSLDSQQRDASSALLEKNDDIFQPGGAPTKFAVHRIDTGECAPISVPPYRVNPSKRVNMRPKVDRMLAEGIRINRDKCVVARPKLKYLDHVVGIEPDPGKVQAVLDMKPPKNLKELRTFLQTCSWFRKFIPQFSEVARPLTDLTTKKRRWHWGEDESNAFEQLKVRLTSSPIPRQPDFNEPFILRTDASAFAVGADLPHKSPDKITATQLADPEIKKIIQDFENDAARLPKVAANRVKRQQERRKAVADKHRREEPSYQVGDLVLLENHRLSSAAQGYTAKFGPRRDGPYRIRRLVSPTSFEVEDKDGVLLGKYHVSGLTPYLSEGKLLSKRKKGRSAKSLPRRIRDLEGETIAPVISYTRLQS